MKFRELLDNAEEIVAGVGLVLVIIVTAYSIFNRYVLEQSAVWAPELAGIIYAWVVFLGASAAWKRGMHISIDVIVRNFGSRTQRWIRLLGDLILIVFLAYVTFLAIKITISGYTRVSPVMAVPFSYIYAAAAVGFALMLVRRALSLAHVIRSRLASREY